MRGAQEQSFGLRQEAPNHRRPRCGRPGEESGQRAACPELSQQMMLFSCFPSYGSCKKLRYPGIPEHADPTRTGLPTDGNPAPSAVPGSWHACYIRAAETNLACRVWLRARSQTLSLTGTRGLSRGSSRSSLNTLVTYDDSMTCREHPAHCITHTDIQSERR